MSGTMKAINLAAIGGPEVLVSATVPIPTPGPNDVLIRVKAVSVNPVEAKIRAGKWAGGQLPAGSILGFDASGIISSLGSAVPSSSSLKVNDAVWFLGSTIPTHSNAEYVLADYRTLAKKPSSISFEDAAAIPLVGLTAWEMIVEQMQIGLDKNDKKGAVLIINGAGGVGSIATQIVSSYLNMPIVISTASRPASIAHTKSLGATHTISHREPLAPQIKALNISEPIKYVLVFTTTSNDLMKEVIEVAAPRAKIGLAVQGPPGSYDSFGSAQRKGLSFYWGFVFTRMALSYELETQGQALTKMAELVDAGKLKPITSKVLDLNVEGLREAHKLMESGETVGKVVVKVPESGAFA